MTVHTTPISPAERFVTGSVRLASPPLIYTKLMRVLDDPRSGATDLGHVISEDQGLTARILAVVNSAMFALPFRVDSVAAAVRLVGTSQVRDLAIATSVLSLFSGVPDDIIDVDSFRRHSLACGVTARVLASQRGEDNIERFFIAGLLHDIGRLIMIANATEEMRRALERSIETGLDLRQCERDELGCSHDKVGAELLARWRFPDALGEAVRFHHQPKRANRFPVEASAAHVADIVTHGMDWGRSGQPKVPEFDPSAWDLLGLAPEVVRVVVEEAERQLDAAVHLIPGPDGP